MKKTNVLLLALLAFVCLFAVSCDGEPANPANPVNPGKPDDQPVTPPSETSVIDPVKDSELNVYQRIAEYLIDSGDSISETIQESSDVSKLFGDISGDPSSDETENARLAFLGIAFSINGKFDYLGDDEPYIEIGGTKYYEFSGSKYGEFEIRNLSLGSLSAVLDEVSETRMVAVKDLVYDIEFSSPTVPSMRVSMSAEFEFEVYYDEEDGEWYSSEDGSYSGSLTLDGRTWDSIEYDAEKAEYRYGEYVRSLWCTVKFDSKGGTSVETQRVLIGEYADEPDAPKKNGNFIFMEWRNVKDDEPYDFDEVYEDIELYAAYYTPIPAVYEGEVHSMYKLSELLRNVDHTTRPGNPNTEEDVKNLFGLNNKKAEAYLFELMLLSLGKIDSYDSSPYYEIDGARYYLAKGDADGEGFVANKDYTYSISGTGACRWSKSSDFKSSSERWSLIDLSYTVNIVKDGSSLKSIPVYIDFAYLEVESIFGDSSSKMVETSIVVKFDFDDESDNRVERSFKFDRDSNIGFYCDYYFDSSSYSQNL